MKQSIEKQYNKELLLCKDKDLEERIGWLKREDSCKYYLRWELDFAIGTTEI